ncbi:MAG TPA: family 1 glycosylhydrolase [Tessaracoccus flavescens]|uniref:Family 1 glycosylhydrolase n=1 Tax=Tessaracoccus flavescens TaxID=399497 RepID=A0A921JQT7_9ACTN|nr:family 1 glycosylhydrolase [Tessaracoccus flavescens]
MDIPFELGFATAATQIEGGDADTIWHRWADAGGAADGSTPHRAGDHWNRVDEDVELLRSFGVTIHRMGLEWARIEPRQGSFDPAAIEHYRHELTLLREAGIRPLVTLHHFNDPVWFSELGGFRGRHATDHFDRYVRHVVTSLGDLVDEWITINEPNVFAYLGYFLGEWPPAQRGVLPYLSALRGMAKAHQSAYQLIHAIQPTAKVGVAHHLRDFQPARPANPLDRLITWGARFLFQGWIVRATSRTRGGFWADFFGVNYYSTMRMRLGVEDVPAGTPVNDLGWEIDPGGLSRVIERYSRHCPGPVYVTENGTADADDAFRCRLIAEHLEALTRTDAAIERYYHWTFIDNWEWAEGEGPRFGVVALDYDTQERTRRPSANFYADIIVNRAITVEARARWVEPQTYPRTGSGR